MDESMLFVDGSVDTQSKTGFGAYLALDSLSATTDYQSEIKVKRFEKTSSTKLELQTLLWALAELNPSTHRLIIYTDSQNTTRLPGRRERLEEAQFESRSGKPLNNARLYQEFYRISDKRNCRFEKVKGHQSQSKKGPIETVFTQVDRAARAALRRFRASTLCQSPQSKM